MNAYEDRARRKKVDAIVEYIWSRLDDAGKVDPESVNAVRLAGQEARDLVAKDAGQRSPSTETWALVVHDFAERVKAARWGLERGRVA